MSPSGSPFAAGGRRLMRQIREIMEASGDAQARLDRFVNVIAANLVADVCSVYLRRPSGAMELCATVGLARSAVHATRLRPGEGLVGQVATHAEPLAIENAPAHPAFSYHPETEEEGVVSFLGAPILRGGRLLGVLTVQNRTPRAYGEDDIELLQTAAMVLGEVLADPSLAASGGLEDLEIRPTRPERLQGRSAAGGLAIGRIVKREPHVSVSRLIAEDPEREAVRVEEAVSRLRRRVDDLLDGRLAGLEAQSREVLEAYRMIAHDRGWLRRLQEAARLGLTAEAAVDRVRSEQRARLRSVRDPYLRARLSDFEALADRLLQLLAEASNAGAGGGLAPIGQPKAGAGVEDAVLVARDIGPAELLEIDPSRLRGVLLEEGSPNSHAAIVARAFGAPMIGRLDGVLDKVEAGDLVIVDGDSGEAHLRPSAEVLEAYRAKIELSNERQADFAKLRARPAITLDGRRIALYMNAGLRADLAGIDRSGADGVGLFRTEFQFMVAERLPRHDEQTALYRAALDAAGDRPVVFRTLDLGGDKILPYAQHDREANPAMGWRAVRMALDRPGLMRYQLRALVEAAEGRDLRVMFPLVSTAEEFTRARALVEAEVDRARRRGRGGPKRVEVGAMLETPALAFQLHALLETADFISVGANDLLQFFFAADRGHPKLADRYDPLSPAALTLFQRIREACAARGAPVSVCGEMAGRPLEALALAALGYDRLSMAASSIGPIKRMILSLDAGAAAARLLPLMNSPKSSLRDDIADIARALNVAL